MQLCGGCGKRMWDCVCLKEDKMERISLVTIASVVTAVCAVLITIKVY